MTFDIFANPFTVLGLTTSSDARSVGVRTRESGDAAAGAAGRILLSPSSRLAAEVSHLPGASEPQVIGCLNALRVGMEPDLWALTPTSRANILAHLASAGKATANQIRELVGLQDGLPDDAILSVAKAREASGLPPATREHLNEAIETLSSLHAEAVGTGATALHEGARLLAGLLPPQGVPNTARALFLRRAAAAWERSTSDLAAQLKETAAVQEVKLRDRPDPPTASRLAETIEALADLGRPSRAAASIFGLAHDPSDEAIQRWRSLAIDLSNDSDAIVEATTILEAVAAGFGIEGDLGGRVAEDLATCRGRIKEGHHRPEARRLRRAIAAANERPEAFMRAHLHDGRPTAATPLIAVELCAAFVAASESSPSESPWWELRALTLRLHNEFSSTEAAFSLTTMAIVRAQENPIAGAVLPTLLGDARTLRAQILQRELGVALQKKQKRVARRVLDQLVKVTDDTADRMVYERALAKMRSESNATKVRWGITAAAVGALVLACLLDNKSTSTPANNSGAGFANSQVTPGSDWASSSDRTASPQDTGSSNLSLEELRWCEYRSATGKAALDYVEMLRANPATDVARFNASVAAVNAYNHTTDSACNKRNYLKFDGTIIDSEVSTQASRLTSKGQSIVNTAYLDAGVTQPDPQTIFSEAAPVAAAGQQTTTNVMAAAELKNPQSRVRSPTATTASKAYLDGQTDRRGIEDWMNSLSGDASVGAHWWAGVRSSRHPPSCANAPAHGDQIVAAAGCNEARKAFSIADKRRRAESEYRAGWNNP